MLSSRTMFRNIASALGVFATIITAGACRLGTIPIGDNGCTVSSDCADNGACVNGVCVGGGTSGFGGGGGAGPTCMTGVCESVGTSGVGGTGGAHVGVSSSGGVETGSGGSVGVSSSSSGGVACMVNADCPMEGMCVDSICVWSGTGGASGVSSSSSGSMGVGGGSSMTTGTGGGSGGGQGCQSTADCPAGEFCVSGVCQGTCVPATCAELGFNCGTVSDGCDSVLHCGTCTSPAMCADGICTP